MWRAVLPLYMCQDFFVAFQSESLSALSADMALSFAQLPRLGIQFSDSTVDPGAQIKTWAERLERQWKNEKEKAGPETLWQGHGGAQTQRARTAPAHALSSDPHRPRSTQSRALDASFRVR